MGRFMKQLVTYILLVLLASCGVTDKANRKAKRAERLLNEAIALGAKVGTDTVFKEIPVFIDSVRVDSIFTAGVGDTVYLEKDRLKIKYIRLKADTFYIEGRCEADTVKITVPVEVKREIKTGAGFWDIFRIVLFAVVLTALLVTFYWKVVK